MSARKQRRDCRQDPPAAARATDRAPVRGPEQPPHAARTEQVITAMRQFLESHQVELVDADLEQVTGRLRHDGGAASIECTTQLRHVHLQGVHGVSGGLSPKPSMSRSTDTTRPAFINSMASKLVAGRATGGSASVLDQHSGRAHQSALVPLALATSLCLLGRVRPCAENNGHLSPSLWPTGSSPGELDFTDTRHGPNSRPGSSTSAIFVLGSACKSDARMPNGDLCHYRESSSTQGMSSHGQGHRPVDRPLLRLVS